MCETKDYTRLIVQKRPILHNVTSRITNTMEYTGKPVVRTFSLSLSLYIFFFYDEALSLYICFSCGYRNSS
jgi:hypothetical protein